MAAKSRPQYMPLTGLTHCPYCKRRRSGSMLRWVKQECSEPDAEGCFRTHYNNGDDGTRPLDAKEK